jgi:hypothetical protein
MKTFSDITAIDTDRKLIVNLYLRRRGTTKSHVTINDLVIQVDQINFKINLFDPIVLAIDLEEFVEGTSGIEVELVVNDIGVLPKYQHLSSSGNNYIDKKGVWYFKIPNNFYVWYHNISGQGFIA